MQIAAAACVGSADASPEGNVGIRPAAADVAADVAGDVPEIGFCAAGKGLPGYQTLVAWHCLQDCRSLAQLEKRQCTL